MFRSKSSQTVTMNADKGQLDLLISLSLPDEVSELSMLGSQRNRRKRLATGRAHAISVKN